VVIGNTAPSSSLDQAALATSLTTGESDARVTVVALKATVTSGATLRKAAGDTALLITTLSRNPFGMESNLK
jgi:hypothetical protein